MVGSIGPHRAASGASTLLNKLADSALADGRVDEAVERGRERVQSLTGSRDRSGLAFARLKPANALLAQGGGGLDFSSAATLTLGERDPA